jgi:hypothetical protein
MENLILRRGDFVKALCDVETETGTLQRGQVYLVETLLDGGLGVSVLSGLIELVRPNGTLTDACLDVTKHQCPVTLPRGANQG